MEITASEPHVTEFAVLGAFTFLLAARNKKKITQQLSSIALFGLIIALTDMSPSSFSTTGPRQSKTSGSILPALLLAAV